MFHIMNKKYFAVLLALAFLASCGAKTEVIETPAESGALEWQELLGEKELFNEIEKIADEVENTTGSGVNETPIDETEAEANAIQTLTQTYTSPGGEETVAFTIHMDDSQIEKVEVVGTSNNDISKARIQAFADAINTTISGKTLAEAKSIGVIGGSSLTTGAFKEALKSM